MPQILTIKLYRFYEKSMLEVMNSNFFHPSHLFLSFRHVTILKW